MVCTFIGHRDTPFSIREQLEAAIIALIKQGVCHFYVGNKGNFDFLAQDVLSRVIAVYTGVGFDIVLSALDEKPLLEKATSTIFPEELALVPKKFAFCKRNDYMLKKADFVIAYATHSFSNSYKFIQKAQKSGCTVINLAKI